jgi:type IV secretion system protein VirB4
MLALAEFRSEAAGLPDLLNYAALIDDGIVLGKDGSLIAGFAYHGDDTASSTNNDRNHLTAMVNQYLSRFGAGWALWVDASRRSSPDYTAADRSFFPDPISALIDAERRSKFEATDKHYETTYALILQYLPPRLAESKLGDLLYDDDQFNETNIADRILLEFKRRLHDLQDGLGSQLHLKRLGSITIGEGESAYLSDELVNHLHSVLNASCTKLQVPSCPMYLDSWLGYQELWPGDTPKLGTRFISCVTIDGFPGQSYPGVLDILDGLPLSYRWSTRFIYMDQHEAEFALNRYRLKWQQKIHGFVSQVFRTRKGMVNTDALNMTNDAEQAINDAKSGLVKYGYYTTVVVLAHENRKFLEEMSRFVKKEVERRGFFGRIETVNTLEAWLGTLPGMTYPNIRRPLLHTLNLADLLPLSSVWPGLPENPNNLYPAGSPPLMHTVTNGATPFQLNLHVGDVGHTLIFGPTGAGKSTLLALVHAQFRRYRGRIKQEGIAASATITAFDKGRSLLTLCHAIGGAHYDLGGDDHVTPALTPLIDIETDAEVLWAEEWIATCFELQANCSPTPHQCSQIHQAIMLLSQAPRNQRSLTHFLSTVQDAEIRDALKHYTISGAMGHLLDGSEEGLAHNNYTVYEIDELMKLGLKNALPVLLYLFRRFEKSLKGQPAMLSLDEAWVMLGHPVFREKIRQWLKELRKKNCLVIMATQSLSDAVHSGLLDVLQEQCPTKVFLPNKEADLRGTPESPGPADFYSIFGLNTKEVSLLKNAQYKKDYYYKSPLGRRMFELGLGPIALAFVAISDKEEVAAVSDMINKHGKDWPFHWLECRHIDFAQYLNAV